jgi:hypothetical protein
MKPVRQLVRVKHGSHLYGTSTPASDQDFKGVHLPSGEAIVMQRAENVINTGVASKAEGTLKNDADAIDSDSYSVQKFYEMLCKGDTVATEILFAPPEAIVEQHPLWGEVQAMGKLLLNRQCKGFVGYCVRQAAKYGIKGSRMAAVKGVLDELSKLGLGRATMTTKMSVIEPQLRKWSEGREHVKWENLPNPNGTDNWHLDVCDRKISMNVHIGEAYKVWEKVWENYGERARAAMTNEGIDWKAMSHAVRVAGQAIELLDHGRITFPRPEAAALLKIKQGKVHYDHVSSHLETLVAKVQERSLVSSLPEKSDHKLANREIFHLYKMQIKQEN